ncbi:ribokinase [Actinoplanes sp. OR16]|uniref:PfkB family carbohydrate kinase n=1 Tax=Actinoplanes sp. OR16 TaxID=946334 RepID=UPI000F6EF461|nr:PfkB family carbohydrate kinase [Actinoplanes sp. OR16]BBH70877.1 ribokinase [Actinoplanes sp. OR16]
MRILCVGLATVDLVQRVDRLPGADEKVQSDSVEVAAGGPATNAAVTAAALGADVTLVSAVGGHPLGDLIRADLAAHGVTLIDATPDSPEPPPVSAVTVLSGTGERTIVSHNAGRREVPLPASGLPDADLTLVDGHHPLLAVAASRAARRLLVDAGSPRPIFTEIFPHAELVACSAAFRPWPLHPRPSHRWPSHPWPFHPGDDDATIAAAIPAPTVLVTHGPAPVRWFTPHDHGEIPVPPVAAVDTSGAGDAFHGALAVAMTRGDDLRTAVTFAVRVAGTRVAHPGPRTWLSHL